MFRNVPKHILWAIVGLYALLIVASLVTRAMRARAADPSKLDELTARIRSWWVMVTIFSIAIVVGRVVSLVFLGLVSYLSLKEYLSLIPSRRADRRVLLWIYLAVPLQYYWVHLEWYGMFIVFVPVYLFLFLPLRMVTVGETKGYLRAAGTLHWGAMLCVFSLSHAAYLLVLPAEVNPGAGGAGLLLFLVVLTQLNDVAQFLWGKSFGKRKVVPSVSPGKTVEGLVGGVATTTVLALLLAPFLTPLTTLQALGAGLIIGIAGFVGDVSLSALKRDLGVKDSGASIPGHGGILDRVDSLTYTAPLFFHYVYYIAYP